MRMIRLYDLLLLILSISCVLTTHFLGGSITWHPLNSSSTNSPVQIVITQTYLWKQTTYSCSAAQIASGTYQIPIGNSLGGNESLRCISPPATCPSDWDTQKPTIKPYCTDVSSDLVTTVGQRSDVVTLDANANFTIAFQSGMWRTLNNPGTGTIQNNDAKWSVSTSIDLIPRSDGTYNSAPVATMLSPINIPVLIPFIIQIPVVDADGDVIRCRWAQSTATYDECGSDFIDSLSTDPLSAVPVQFLLHVVNASACGVKPQIIGIPVDQSCIPVVVGQVFTTQLIALNSCPGTIITDIATLSFLAVDKGNTTKYNSSIWYKTLTWIPLMKQLGSQVMCAIAIDNVNSQSTQYCITFYVSIDLLCGCPGPELQNCSTTTISGAAARRCRLFSYHPKEGQFQFYYIESICTDKIQVLGTPSISDFPKIKHFFSSKKKHEKPYIVYNASSSSSTISRSSLNIPFETEATTDSEIMTGEQQRRQRRNTNISGITVTKINPFYLSPHSVPDESAQPSSVFASNNYQFPTKSTKRNESIITVTKLNSMSMINHGRDLPQSKGREHSSSSSIVSESKPLISVVNKKRHKSARNGITGSHLKQTIEPTVNNIPAGTEVDAVKQRSMQSSKKTKDTTVEQILHPERKETLRSSAVHMPISKSVSVLRIKGEKSASQALKTIENNSSRERNSSTEVQNRMPGVTVVKLPKLKNSSSNDEVNYVD
ncbi:unnamed protein product [Didymodactylos carnosus]|uniref:Uncharacterized protein n=1 Tax=Didymodactylos carnosus TaxID=1234261 RepID=A0A814PJE3_9BILA|nr:unnamed protein product [Didymodactylos carnosus]CAF1106960.1 unnamed protein product [Didymodactylos carnosus]CAF3535542.1 unnamed protein product [Didymodactylos carnosus]CAF3871594.1 unnamed protein product [Didymodactylos carnosus]